MMRRFHRLCQKDSRGLQRAGGWALVLALAGSGCRPDVASGLATTQMTAVMRDALCVTEGALVDAPPGFAVRQPRFRAVLADDEARSAELEFVYLGPSAEQEALSSGLSKQQVGLKLRAADACNVIYVMWEMPRGRIAVLGKSNPDAHRSDECGNRGYKALTPALPLSPRVEVGSKHRLSAALDGRHLIVDVDGRTYWDAELEGDLPPAGPVGVRSDNVNVDIVLRAVASGSGASGGCRNVR